MWIIYFHGQEGEEVCKATLLAFITVQKYLYFIAIINILLFFLFLAANRGRKNDKLIQFLSKSEMLCGISEEQFVNIIIFLESKGDSRKTLSSNLDIFKGMTIYFYQKIYQLLTVRIY